MLVGAFEEIKVFLLQIPFAIGEMIVGLVAYFVREWDMLQVTRFLLKILMKLNNQNI
jgi:hypothetical protein